MKEIDTHIILISSQAVPNITPVLDERFRPRQVIMLVSEDMRKRSEYLEKIYQPRGIKVSHWPIVDAWDIEHIRERMLELFSKYEAENLALNATGGTKPMSIAAYEVFREFEKPIFYIHPELDRLIWMYPPGQETVELADKIKIREYLYAYGAAEVIEKNRTGVSQKIRNLSKELIRNIHYFDSAFGKLNYLAATAENRQLTSEAAHKSHDKDLHFQKLVDLFARAGQLQRSGRQLVFPDEQARFMVNGGWMEDYVYACCLDLKQSLQLQDISRGIEVTRKQHRGKVLNELDVVFLKDNRLYLIECKTKRFSGNSRKHSETDDVLYKLDSLRDLLGGLQAKAMLVSLKKIKNHHKQRAKTLDIEICCNQDLQWLSKKICQWVQDDD